MVSFANATIAWITPSGIIPSAVLFDIVPFGTCWLVIAGLLAVVCALLSVAVNPSGTIGRRRRLRLVRSGPVQRRPHVQQA
jgi:hypothetical protein